MPTFRVVYTDIVDADTEDEACRVARRTLETTPELLGKLDQYMWAEEVTEEEA